MELQTELFIKKLEDKKMEENRKKLHEMIDEKMENTDKNYEMT